jgi:RsiW-degrading membrane proteinase PrsW (M82 family)
MIKSLFFISLAPILIVAIYIYLRDKYEKEPLLSLIKALLLGMLIVLPAVFIEKFLGSLNEGWNEGITTTFYSSFIVASLTEEGLKFSLFILFFWKSVDFNEKFDGIVYAVFISLGFAAIENLFYVFRGGYSVGLLRALTAVPAHALFGTQMGYHLGLARFYPDRRKLQLIMAFLMPFIWHGTYDFLLMGHNQYLMVLFIPLVIFFWISGLRKMNELSKASVFRDDWNEESEIADNADHQT